MKQITNKEYEAYQQFQSDRLHGRILTPNGLRFICASLQHISRSCGIRTNSNDADVRQFFSYTCNQLPSKSSALCIHNHYRILFSHLEPPYSQIISS